jgi:hypothetical protein
MAIAGIYDGKTISTEGCGCCSDSICIEHKDALEEALNSVGLLIEFCEKRNKLVKNDKLTIHKLIKMYVRK